MDPIRHQKAEQMRASGVIPYAAKFQRSHMLTEAAQLKDDEQVQIAGRVMLMREMGKIAFLTLQDHTGRMQIALKEDILGADVFANALKLIDLGDFIGVHGSFFTTQKGEPTIAVSQWEMLTKSLRQPPEKWHGVQDQETAWRQRYLDMMSNRSTMERFEFRSLFIRKMREFYWNQDFIEVEIPILVNSASGALATPFVTHHEAYDMDVYLRIAYETHLKECLVGGMDRIFECGRVFRNEGLDPSHLQDFTMVEHMAAYWSYEENMKFTEDMMEYILNEILGTTKIKIPDRDGNLVEVDFKPPWPKISIREAIQSSCGIDIESTASADELRALMKKKGVKLDIPVETLGRGNLIDQIYKKVSRPSLIQPTFLIQHPVELSPLARLNDDNPSITDRFQLVVGGWEIVNAYSELVDPVDQAERFAEQAKAHAGGDSDAHEKDDEFVTALEYGCPPCSGWGMGVDRIVALLTQQNNLRETVLFPLMKPETKKLSAREEEERYRSKKVVVIADTSADAGVIANAVGQLGIEIGGHSKETLFDARILHDAEDRVHYTDCLYPMTNLGGTREQMAEFAQKCYDANIQFFDFTDIMRKAHTDKQMREGYKAKKTSDIGYLAVGALIPSDFEEEWLSQLSLYGTGTPLSETAPVSQTSAIPEELPDEHSKRFIAILNKKAEMGRLVNALGHMTAGLSNLASQSEDLCFLEYNDADEGVHPNISHYPFIVLKADNSNKIRTVRQEALDRGIPFTDFTSTMTIGTSQEQQDATKESKEEDLEYLGICLFGDTEELKEFTKKFSLFG